MKKSVLVFIVLLLLHRSFSLDYRILQADKDKVFVSIIKSVDNILQVSIFNADWRIDYIQKGEPCHKADVAEADTSFRHKIVHLVSEHHSHDSQVRSFYKETSGNATVNDIFTIINSEYCFIMQKETGYKLIKKSLPDSLSEYYVHGERGKNAAAIELIYLWGAPLRDWSSGFTFSIHDREARKVLSSISCVNPADSELGLRKIKIRQTSLLSIMNYADLLCQ